MHTEDLNDPVTNKDTVTDNDNNKPLISEANGVPDGNNCNSIPQEDEINDIGTEANEEDFSDRRNYPRSEFTYPVEFRMFSRNSDQQPLKNPDQASFNGYLKDISLSGACLQYEDRYGRFNLKEISNAKIKISFSIPNGDKVSIFAQIRWARKIDPRNFSFKMGIEFKDLEAWQLDTVEKLIGMRNKDHNMMWNLWEQYENNCRP